MRDATKLRITGASWRPLSIGAGIWLCGPMVFHVFAALAEFERDIIGERTAAGLVAARARGKKGGRPKSLDEAKRRQAVTLYEDKSNTIDEICRTLRIGRTTLYRYLGKAKS